MHRLSIHLQNRLADLSKAKEEGRKIIGYMPGGYMPEELVIASGAIPIGPVRGGDYSVVEIADSYICRWIDPFCRAQIGYGVSAKDPYYNMIDLLVVPVTDNHIRAVMDILDYHTDIDIFPFGVPHMKENSAFDYYVKGLDRLKSKLEVTNGVEITDSKLREAMHLCNRERELFRKISLKRKSRQTPINSKDFVALHHASFLADKKVMVEILESVYEELEHKGPLLREGPRILLTGSTLALGDNDILDVIEEAGGVIVVEEFAEGMRPYWEDVKPDGNLMVALADCYFMRRVPPAWFRPGKERLDFLVQLAKDFMVAGVIWYQLMYRESYKLESFYFPKILERETGLSMLTVESEYEHADREVLRTWIETFIDTLRK